MNRAYNFVLNQTEAFSQFLISVQKTVADRPGASSPDLTLLRAEHRTLIVAA